ncbi:MAG: ABC transporter permease [Mycolicibacterium hassiacum]|uniref:ABC transporter permease n=1 Tax=Mycolicibacterium hassiacum TaxID=46351 RepID=UPI0023F6664F|nr:ABC transporter permease [Mycolicibacterium hassiacum]MBX5485442.1 ABC transporter permease [Mycolicibacterium hassiacum]
MARALSYDAVLEGRRRALRDTRRRRLRDAWHVLARNPLTLVGVLLVLLLVLVAILAPAIAPHDPLAQNADGSLLGPSWNHPFGTDSTGRDVFSRVLYGAAISLRIGGLAVLAIMVVGVPLGLLAGSAGGWVDGLIMRLADIFLAFPTLVLALAIATSLGGGMENVIIAVAIAGWPWYARVIRSAVLGIKGQAYIDAARLAGSSWWRIVWRHILPNSFGPIIVQASQDMGYTILLAASLGFLGIGVKIPTPEWGTMINDGRDVFLDAWWVSVFPGLAIVVAVLAFNLLGDGLRDLFDPRTRR